MIKIFFKISIYVLLITLSCSSCSKQQISISDNCLYSEMVEYSYHYKELLQDDLIFKTKSDDSYYDIMSSMAIDYSILGERFIHYLEEYTCSENIYEWDERAILNIVFLDQDFSDEMKTVFAKTISFAYFVKYSEAFPGIIVTKSSEVDEEDCYKLYDKASWRALRRALITLGVGLLEPTIAGESLAIAMYLLDINEAEEDFENCLDRLLNDENFASGGDDDGVEEEPEPEPEYE